MSWRPIQFSQRHHKRHNHSKDTYTRERSHGNRHWMASIIRGRRVREIVVLTCKTAFYSCQTRATLSDYYENKLRNGIKELHYIPTAPSTAAGNAAPPRLPLYNNILLSLLRRRRWFGNNCRCQRRKSAMEGTVWQWPRPTYANKWNIKILRLRHCLIYRLKIQIRLGVVRAHRAADTCRIAHGNDALCTACMAGVQTALLMPPSPLIFAKSGVKFRHL